MRCAICEKTEDETYLFDGVGRQGIIKVCKDCAEEENIPILKKPKVENIENERKLTVRERMERMSGMTKKKDREQLIANKNLNRLKIPPKKQTSNKLVDNYDWDLKMYRRRKKISLKQLSEKTQVSEKDLENFEKGQLPENFERIAERIEIGTGLKLLNRSRQEVNFIMPEKKEDKEKEILNNVKQKMKEMKEDDFAEYVHEIDEEVNKKNLKEEKLKKLEKGELDLSKRKDVQDITLSDLQKMKKEREEADMFGEDIELED